MQYVILFLEGVYTFISPCLLPMLPIYFSYFAAGEERTTIDGKRKTLTNALGFVLGFTIVFVSLGAFAGTLGKLLREYSTIFNLVTGFIVVIFGLNFLGVLNIKFLNKSKEMNVNTKNLGFLSSVLFGVVFSIGWTPCVGAFLGSALMLAAQPGSAIQGSLMLFVFSMGLAVPMLISALLIERFKAGFDFIKKHYKIINMISGGMLVVVGIMMMTGLMGYFLSLLTF